VDSRPEKKKNAIVQKGDCRGGKQWKGKRQGDEGVNMIKELHMHELFKRGGGIKKRVIEGVNLIIIFMYRDI
jgi:hypothetical protein